MEKTKYRLIESGLGSRGHRRLHRRVPLWFSFHLEYLVQLADNNIADLEKDSYVNALMKGSESGSPLSKYLLGILYEYLSRNVDSIDISKAENLIMEAATAGLDEAINWCVETTFKCMMGWKSWRGERLVELCRIAAEQGDPRGQFLFSMMLIQGELIAKDEHLSQYWLDKAYEQGFDPTKWLNLMAQEIEK